MGLNNADIGGADLFADAIRSYTSICRSESHPRFDCMNIRPAKAGQSIVRTITLLRGRVGESEARGRGLKKRQQSYFNPSILPFSAIAPCFA